MIKAGVLLIIISIFSFNFQLNEELKEEEIYSKILTEFLSGAVYETEDISKVLIKKELQKESLGEELKYDDLSYLLAISKNLLIIKDSLARPDSVVIEMVNKFEKSENNKEVDFSKIKLPYEIELISKKKFLRKVKGKNGWKRFRKKNPNTFGVIEFSNLVYSDDKRYCALYVGYLRGGLRGYGCILIADLKGEKLIKGEIELWVA